MAAKCKFREVANQLEKRIRRGEYLLGGFPSERSFADEVGISHMTARKAMRVLEGRGIVSRKKNGRLVVDVSKQGFFGILVPEAFKASQSTWFNAVRMSVEKVGQNLCRIDYANWEDAGVWDALQNLRGVFLLPPEDGITREVAERLMNAAAPLAILGEDYSEYGLRSIVPHRPSHIQNLLDYIAGFGHRRIDCINTEPFSPSNEKCLAQWHIWQVSRNCSGEFYNHPTDSCEEVQYKAREVILNLVNNAGLRATALLCSSEGAALGTMRGLWESGISPGRDISVAAMSGEVGRYRLYHPSLCCLENQNVGSYLRICASWMLDPEKRWIGPLLLAPDFPRIFEGESVQK